MRTPLTRLEEHLDALRGLWQQSLPSFGAIAGNASAEMRQMSGFGLVAVTDALSQLRRDTEALLARAAAEVAERSTPQLGVDGLAKACGFANPARLIAASTGTTVRDASKLLRVGAATAPRRSFTSDDLPARHPSVAAGLAAGAIGTDAAELITSMLDRVASRAEPALAAEVEKILTEHALNPPGPAHPRRQGSRGTTGSGRHRTRRRGAVDEPFPHHSRGPRRNDPPHRTA